MTLESFLEAKRTVYLFINKFVKLWEHLEYARYQSHVVCWQIYGTDTYCRCDMCKNAICVMVKTEFKCCACFMGFNGGNCLHCHVLTKCITNDKNHCKYYRRYKDKRLFWLIKHLQGYLLWTMDVEELGYIEFYFFGYWFIFMVTYYNLVIKYKRLE